MSEQSEQSKDLPHDPDTVVVKLALNGPSSVLLKDANLFVIAIPLGLPKETALGILFSELMELRTWYKNLEQAAKAKKSNIIMAGANAFRKFAS